MNDSNSKSGDKKPPIIRPKAANGGGLPHPKVPGSEESPTRSTDAGAPPRVNLKAAGETIRIEPVVAPPDETARIPIAAPSRDATERVDMASAKRDETERIQMGAAKKPSETDRLKAGHTDRIDLGAAKKPGETDRIDLGAAKKPGDTARIDVPGATPAKDTDRIVLPRAPAHGDTDRIDLAAAKPHGDTDRINVSALSPAEAGEEEEFTRATLDPSRLAGVIEKTGKRTTDRIDLAEAIPLEPPPVAPPAPKPVSAAADTERLMAASTIPIQSLDAGDILSATTLPMESVLSGSPSEAAGPGGVAQKNQTMRVELDADELAKGDTARLSAMLPSEAPAPARPPGTSRIDLAGQPDAEDVLRRRSAEAAGAAAAGARRPGATARVPAPPSTELGEPPKSPPRPGTARIAVEPPTKSATARIEVEASDIPHAPPRPKSIKFKRAEGAAKKPEAATSGLPTSVVARPSSESFGLVAGLAAVASVLVMVALVYVLAAQTIATQLPFPGRM